MVETITKEIDGIKFHIQQFPALKALRIEKKVMTLILPSVGSLIGGIDLQKGLDTDLDFSNIGQGLMVSLEKLSDNDFETLILELLGNTQFEITGEAVEFIGKSNFDKVFQGKLITVYKVIFEIMKVNKFCFFEVVGGGLGMVQTNILSSSKKNVKK